MGEGESEGGRLRDGRLPVEGDGEDAVGEAEGLLDAVAVVRVHVHVSHPPEPPGQPHQGERRVVDLPSERCHCHCHVAVRCRYLCHQLVPAHNPTRLPDSCKLSNSEWTLRDLMAGGQWKWRKRT